MNFLRYALISNFTPRFLCAIALLAPAIASHAADAPEIYEPKPTNSYFAKFNPRKAPEPGPLFLKEDDRLAIIGDSITEQRIYSRIMETYLTVCVPQLKVTTRQFGWSGETAEGFRRRMTNDCFRFKPTVATLCYGMNDHRYRPFDVMNGMWYRSNYTAVVKGLKDAGARVVVGSPGCMSKPTTWGKVNGMTLDEHNANLCALRDIDVGIATREEGRFADVFWTMMKAGFEGQTRFSTAEEPYMIAGKDGVHPGGAGHLVMAYSFLKAMGLDGDVGTITVDLASQKAEASAGHKVEGVADGEVTVTSSRYPFCATGDTNKDSSVRSGMEVVPFNQDLNRFRLVVKNATASNYKVTWGEQSKSYSPSELSAGVNLAADFAVNPFSDAFKKVDEAVAVKQAYETTQIKKEFRGIVDAKKKEDDKSGAKEEGKKEDMESIVKRTEAVRAPLVESIKTAFVPVKHTIKIQAAQ